MFIHKSLRRVIVGQRGRSSCGQRLNAVVSLPHERQQGIQSGHAARVAALEPSDFVQPLHAEDISAMDRSVEEHNGANTGMRKRIAVLGHGIQPGRRLRLRASC
ncbi:MAG: hypothetical protein HP491_08265 [Nitrospira sp.]|nr:hypothetical protein [Nitrospira sp.]